MALYPNANHLAIKGASKICAITSMWHSRSMHGQKHINIKELPEIQSLIGGKTLKLPNAHFWQSCSKN